MKIVRTVVIPSLALIPALLWAEPAQPSSSPDHHREAPVDLWKQRLDLTDEQTQKLKSDFDANQTGLQSLRQKRKQGLEKLKSQLENKASDKDVQASLDELIGVQDSIDKQQKAFRDEIAAYLTPTQRAKMLLGIIGPFKQRKDGLGPRLPGSLTPDKDAQSNK